MLVKTVKRLNCLIKALKAYYKGLPIKAMVALSLLVGLLMALWATAITTSGSPAFGGDIIRLHVLANSDDAKDQEIKLKVRDAVLEYSKPYLCDLENGKAAKSIILSKLSGIEQAANNELSRLGVKQRARVEFGVSDFPVKTYGNVTLPAGRYQAVRVIIGQGKGRNWWCVMFPPLCMVDASHSQAQDKSVKIIQQNLDGYDILNGGQKQQPRFKIGFKLLEIFKGFGQQKNYN